MNWLKALHVIAVISWMAGMLYLPRLFVYHADAAPGSELAQTFKTMERRLLTIIMNPAMIVVWLTGLSLMVLEKFYTAGWLDTKLLLVLIMSGMHGFFTKTVKDFSTDNNRRSSTFYRQINEVPTVLMIVIVILVVVKPF